MGLLDTFANSIASIESGGKYDLLGPVTKTGDRAYGKYQVMGNNIPEWTREILGQSMTPDEFRANPQAQDAVFHGKFGQYVEKFGPEGAAQAWFAGPGGVGKLDRKDQLGTSVGEYGKRFMAGLAGPLPPAQEVASLPPVTTPVGSPPSLSVGKPLPPQPLNLGSNQNIPAFQWTPQQQVAQEISQQASQPAANPMQMAQAMRRPIDLARLQSYLAQLPAAIRPYPFRG